jgi:membrane protein required for beta-lactamase induction
VALIAIIAALVLERVLGALPWWGRPTALRRYLDLLRRMVPEAIWRSAAVLPLVILPPLLAVVWIDRWLEPPLLKLLLSGGILLLCLGPRDLADDLKQWLAARERGDHATALKLARLLQQGPGRYANADVPNHQRGLLGALFIQSHERLFGVLLWFIALGPSGALLYRLASRLPRLLYERGDNEAVDTADTLHALLAWIPARLTALLFGLAGSLDDAIREWRALMNQPNRGWRSQTWVVLAETASGSMESESEDGGTELPATLEAAAREALALQWRALLILLACFAFFTTGDWLG